MKNRLNTNINLDLFKFILRKKKVNQSELARLLGVTTACVCTKMRGRARFRDDEVAQIRDYLGLTQAEVVEIFYTGIILSENGIEEVSILHELKLYIELIAKANVIASTAVDEKVIGHVIQKFVADWIREPNQQVFTYPLTDADLAIFKYKFFAIQDIMIHKINPDTNAETVMKLFDSITINPTAKEITLTVNNEKIRSI